MALRDWLSCATIYSYLYSCFRGGKDEFQMFFPSCQVSVVRFYVSLLRFLLLFFFLVLLRLLRRRAVQCPVTICTQCSLPDLDRDRNNFSHDRILSSLKRCLSGIALMFGPRAGLARPRGGLAGARYYPVHLAKLLHVSLPWQDFYAMYLDTYTSTIFTGC